MGVTVNIGKMPILSIKKKGSRAEFSIGFPSSARSDVFFLLSFFYGPRNEKRDLIFSGAIICNVDTDRGSAAHGG